MEIIKGSDLMLFVKQPNGTVKSLAYSTSHQISLSTSTNSISTKDHGFWGATEITGLSWEITTDNLYTVETFNALFDRWNSRQLIDVYFCLKTPTQREGTPPTVNLPGDTYDTWTPTTTKGEEGYFGRVYITSLSANAASGDDATFSATFAGVGALYKGLYGTVESYAGASTDITLHQGNTEVTYEVATGKYSTSETYYIYSNGEMVKVDFGDKANNSDFDEKQVYYKEKAASQA